MLRWRPRRYASVAPDSGRIARRAAAIKPPPGTSMRHGDVIASRTCGAPGPTASAPSGHLGFIATAPVGRRGLAAQPSERLLLSRDVKTASTVVQEDEPIENARSNTLGRRTSAAVGRRLFP